MAKVYLRHVKQAGYCSIGARKLAQIYEIDWFAFLTNGIDSAELSHIDDVQVKRVIELAEKEQNG